MRVYFTGCSGSGKSTLAEYVCGMHGLKAIPSAARTILAEMGYETHAELWKDRAASIEYQNRVFNKQIVTERSYKGQFGGFVSDRCVDHLAFAAMYVRFSPYTHFHLSDIEAYMASLRLEDAIVFHVPPTKECHEAALKQGGRPEFLNWNDMLAFDGMIRYILTTNEITAVPLTPIALEDRKQVVSGTLDMVMRHHQ
jgi:predicted ATPase